MFEELYEKVTQSNYGLAIVLVVIVVAAYFFFISNYIVSKNEPTENKSSSEWNKKELEKSIASLNETTVD